MNAKRILHGCALLGAGLVGTAPAVAQRADRETTPLGTPPPQNAPQNAEAAPH